MAGGDEVVGNGGIGLQVLEDELGLNLADMNWTSRVLQETQNSICCSIWMRKWWHVLEKKQNKEKR